jgi:hypothetical protein
MRYSNLKVWLWVLENYKRDVSILNNVGSSIIEIIWKFYVKFIFRIFGEVLDIFIIIL